MKIHTDTVNETDVSEAAQLAHVDIVALAVKGSRSHNRRIDFLLEGSSPRRPNGGSSGAGTGFAALWDQWGILLHALFLNDPLAKTPYDESGAFFVWRTGNRFATLNSSECCNHKWSFGYPNATVRYSTRECVKECGAIERWMLNGKFADLAMG